MAFTLDSIITGRDNKPPRIVFYAVSGFGKTTFASQAPNPIFIQTEEGIGNLEYARFPVAKKYSDVVDALILLSENCTFSSVVIDTIDALERLIFDEVVRLHNEEGKKQVTSIGDIPFGGGYTKALSLWGEILRALDYIRDAGVMPILLAHSQIKTFTPPDSEGYDRYRFNMHDKASELVKDWCDIVLFGNYKTYTKGAEDEKKRGVGTGQRYIYTQERPAHWGKNRYSLPYEISFDDGKQWSTFADLMWPKKDNKVTKEEAF